MTPDDKTLYARNDDDVDDFAETGYSDAAAEEEYDEEEEEAISQCGAEGGERPGLGQGAPGRAGEAGRWQPCHKYSRQDRLQRYG